MTAEEKMVASEQAEQRAAAIMQFLLTHTITSYPMTALRTHDRAGYREFEREIQAILEERLP